MRGRVGKGARKSGGMWGRKGKSGKRGMGKREEEMVVEGEKKGRERGRRKWWRLWEGGKWKG